MRPPRLTILALLAALTLSACGVGATLTPSPTPTPGPDAADWVFHGGPILTMDPANWRVEALAIRGEEIVAVGDAESVLALAGDETQVVDLQGSALLPGFVDSHSHYFSDPNGNIDEIQESVLSMGITTVGDLSASPESLAWLQESDESGDLRVRVSVYMVAFDNCGGEVGSWYLDHAPTREVGEMLRIGGVKLYADGGSCGPPATSFERADGSHGDLFFTAEELVPILHEIDGHGYQIALHALGDRATAAALDAFATVIADSGNPLRHRIEHNALVAPAFNRRFDEVGVVGTIFGAYPTCFFTGDSDEYAYLTPPEYIEWEWQWRRLLDENPQTVFAWSGDAWVFADPSPIRALFGFSTRQDPRGDGSFCMPGADHLAGAITVEEALPLMTVNSAYALFREEEVGSLTVGRLADIVILTDDPTAIDPAELLNSSVIFTMVGGRAEYCVNVFADLCGSS